MLHLFATTQQRATWDEASLLLLQQKVPFSGDYARGTIFPGLITGCDLNRRLVSRGHPDFAHAGLGVGPQNILHLQIQ